MTLAYTPRSNIKNPFPGGLQMGVKADIEKMAAFLKANRPGATTITVGVRTATLRKALKLKAGQALEHAGFSLRPIGSQRWRAGNVSQEAP